MLRIGSIAAMAGLVPVSLGAVAGPAPAHPAAKVSASALRLVVSHHYGARAYASGYSAIAATGRKSAWVFGGSNPGGAGTPVAARWNGRTLTPSALPAGLTGFINEAGAASADDVWAASQFGGYVLRWNGHHWSRVRRLKHGSITGLTVAGSRSVWLFTTTASGIHQDGAWHYTGSQWRHASGGLAAEVYGASAVSWHDIWGLAAGAKGDMVVRFDGRHWHRFQTGQALAGVRVHDVLALSNHDVWLAGDEARQAGRLVLLHWDGRRWATFPTELHAWAGSLAAGRDGDVLVTATADAGASVTGYVLAASPRGRLRVTTIRSAYGSGVSDVAQASRSRRILVAGSILTATGGNAAIWSGAFPAVRHSDDDDAD
jgi:hypothetical protein